MKYLGVLSFIFLASWTWNIVHTDSEVNFETHSGIQLKLGALIEETIKTRKPESTDIKIEKIWTEFINKSKVKAYFIYSFKDNDQSGITSTTIQGEGLLERQKDDGSGVDRWSLTHVRTTNDAVVFEEGLVVTPDDTNTTTE